MTSRLSSFVPRTSRTLGLASFFALVGAAILAAPGCSDDPTPQPPATGCTDGQTEDTDATDCKQRVCRNGAFVDENDDTEVPDDGNPCTDDTCSDGQPSNAPNTAACMIGDAAGTCNAGECAISCANDTECDDGSSCTNDSCDTASSTCTFVDEPANYDDGNPCTVDTCPGGVETHENAAAGTACGSAGMCDGNGVCTGCSVDTDCPADEPCVDHFCDIGSSTCQSMAKPDGDLTDDTVGDCQLPTCVGGVLTMIANDMDLPEDGNECTTDTCKEGIAANEPLAPESTCSTGVCSEMAMCVECVTAANCMGDMSCSMNTCFDCNNGMKDGTESDVDCGKDCATKCADTMACNEAADCFSSACDNNVCVSCYDGMQNGGESDADCGAVCDLKCGVGKKCDTNADCVTNSCSAVTKLCLVPTCIDMVKNGSESDVDCGGTCPMKCASGKMCSKNSDCLSNSCQNLVCN